MQFMQTKLNINPIVKLILNGLGFLVCYGLFVQFNVTILSRWGCWNDLNWLGYKIVATVPTITSTSSASLLSPAFLVINLLILIGFFYFEYQVLKLYSDRFKK